MDNRYAFWNNKGGTGETSLAFQSMVRYAQIHGEKRVLAVDLCPQANLSELLLGGLNNKGSEKLLARHGMTPRCSIGGYFQLRLPSPYAAPSFDADGFITKPSEYNPGTPTNLDLVCGDPLLELPVGKQSINGHRVQVKEEYLTNSKNEIKKLVSLLP